MGQAPDPSRPRQMLPSFYENITGGNYLDAGLQALGGAGDAVQMMGAAFPPAIAVGAAMKAPEGSAHITARRIISSVLICLKSAPAKALRRMVTGFILLRMRV